jgi:hypothetical protein
MKEKHPSGLTQERWDWPFKTQQERALVAKYFKKLERTNAKQKKDQIHELEEALL